MLLFHNIFLTAGKIMSFSIVQSGISTYFPRIRFGYFTMTRRAYSCVILLLLGALVIIGCARQQVRSSNPKGLTGTTGTSPDRDSDVEMIGRKQYDVVDKRAPRTNGSGGASSSVSEGQQQAKREDATGGENERKEMPKQLDRNPPEQNYKSLEDTKWPEEFDQTVQNRFREHLRRRGWIEDGSDEAKTRGKSSSDTSDGNE